MITIKQLMKEYPDILKKEALVYKVLRALDSSSHKGLIFPSTIINMYRDEAIREQRVKK